MNNYPLPEAILPGDWRIAEGIPRVDLRKRQMWLQLDDDPQWAAVRAHELAHIAFTPENARKPRTVNLETLQAVEDMRVNGLARQAGVSFAAGAPEHVIQGACFLAKDNVRLATLLLVSAFDDAGRNHLYKTLQTTGTREDVLNAAVTLVNGAFARMQGGSYRRQSATPWSYGRTLRVAKWLDSQFRNESKLLGTPKKGKSDGSSDPTKRLPVGEMRVERPTLSASTAHRNIGSTDEGAILRAPWRVTTDQRVFRITKVPKTGSVLIDASGSMGLGPDDVRRIAATVPAGIVAAYSGELHGGPLRILGYHGRISNDPMAYLFGGCNVIDVPALEWLATQPKPRIWVSDGEVTGIDDRLYDSVTQRAHAITQDAQITMVRDTEQACKLLARRRTL